MTSEDPETSFGGGSGESDEGSVAATEDQGEGDLASLLAHDVKNHLAVVEKRLDGYVEENGADYRLEAVLDSVDRMQQLTSQVLELSRQDVETHDPEPLDVEEIAGNAWNGVGVEDAELVVRDPPVVEADEREVLRVFENLFDNAVRHAGEDVTVEVGGTADGFYVEDDGPGVPDALLDEAMEPGVSGGGGSGLGLYIVRRAAELQGWSVEVGENESGGARFEFAVS